MRQGINAVNRIPIDAEIMPYHKIRVFAGSSIKTTHPMGERDLKRTMVVQTHIRSRKCSEDVTWRGSGGYWFWTKKQNCELVE